MLMLVAVFVIGLFDTPPATDPGISCANYTKQPDGGWMANTNATTTSNAAIRAPSFVGRSPITSLLLSREIEPGTANIDGTDVYQYLETNCDKKS